MWRRLSIRLQYINRPAPLSYRLQSHLTPRGCWIPPLALNTTVRLPFCSHRSFSFKVHFFFFFLLPCWTSEASSGKQSLSQKQIRSAHSRGCSPQQIGWGLASLRASVITALPQGMFSRLPGDSVGCESLLPGLYCACVSHCDGPCVEKLD